MTDQPIDRRIARTRRLLQHALLSLLRTKDYEAITVEEICKAANVGRSTFYTHFSGKDDLKRSGLERLWRQLSRRPQAPAASNDVSGEPLSFSLALFAHAHDYVDHYRAMAGTRGGSMMLSGMRDLATGLLREEFERAPRGGDAPQELVVQFAVGAFMAVLVWWLDRGAKPSPTEVNALYRHLAMPGFVARSGADPAGSPGQA